MSAVLEAKAHAWLLLFTDTGRVSVRLTGESYRGSATMDYWEGVRTT